MIRLGYDIRFEIHQPVPIVAMLSVHPSRRHDLREPDRVTVPEGVPAEEYIDAGDTIVVACRARGMGRASGMDLDQKLALVWTARDGELVSTEVFRDRIDALEAAGLRE